MSYIPYIHTVLHAVQVCSVLVVADAAHILLRLLCLFFSLSLFLPLGQSRESFLGGPRNCHSLKGLP